ncbi:Zinc finger protein 287 [Gonioctena quinquepunctata]|nr:Zinc finger protein 287 [Gonioctena quinquepunctata]
MEEPPEIVDHPDLVELDGYSEEHHKDGSQHRCDICGKYFKHSRSLTSHRKRRHWEVLGIPSVKFNCTICNNHYITATGLKRHNLRVHTPDVDFSVPCDICGERDIENLIKDEPPDIDENLISPEFVTSEHIPPAKGPFKCQFCGKGFTQKSSQNTHERIHTGNKPYSCDICQKTFITRDSMKSHKRSHTDERPYECGFCDKKFRQRSTKLTQRRPTLGASLFVVTFVRRASLPGIDYKLM